MNPWKFSKRFLTCSGTLTCLKNSKILKNSKVLEKIFSSDDEKTKDDYVQKLSTSISDSIKDYCKKELQSFKSKVRKSAAKTAQHAEQFITLIDQGRVSISPVTLHHIHWVYVTLCDATASFILEGWKIPISLAVLSVHSGARH